VKQRPQPTKMACRRVDFSRPWRAEARPTQDTHVACFGVSLLNMDVRGDAKRAVWMLCIWLFGSPIPRCLRRGASLRSIPKYAASLSAGRVSACATAAQLPSDKRWSRSATCKAHAGVGLAGAPARGWASASTPTTNGKLAVSARSAASKLICRAWLGGVGW